MTPASAARVEEDVFWAFSGDAQMYKYYSREIVLQNIVTYSWHSTFFLT